MYCGSFLVQHIALASVAKIVVEIAMLPATIRTAAWLKNREKVDVLDTETDFSPLHFKLVVQPFTAAGLRVASAPGARCSKRYASPRSILPVKGELALAQLRPRRGGKASI